MSFQDVVNVPTSNGQERSEVIAHNDLDFEVAAVRKSTSSVFSGNATTKPEILNVPQLTASSDEMRKRFIPISVDILTDTPLLSERKREDIRKAITNDWDLVTGERTPNDRIPVFYRGKHCRVFEHVEFPELIFKLMGLSQANERKQNIDKAREIIKNQSLNFCHVPSAEVIELDVVADYCEALLVMEKAEGITNYFACEEISQKEFEMFPSSKEINEKWLEFFRQAAELICRIGYWDTSWANIILLDNEMGFGFIDFENTKPDKQNITCGLNRLLNCMAHPNHFDEILKIAKKHGVETKEVLAEANHNLTLEESKEKRHKVLELHSQVRKFHECKGITSISQLVEKNQWKSQSIEGKIVKELNNQLTTNAEYDEGSLLQQRCLHWQPLFFEFKTVDRKTFNSHLQTLKERDAICTWTEQPNKFQEELVIYEIYF